MKRPYELGKVLYENPMSSEEDMQVFHWVDEGRDSLWQWNKQFKEVPDVLSDGRIGFRQMAPSCSEYANLKVQEVTR